MAKLLTDDEVFGGASGALLSDEEVFGKRPERTALGTAGDIGVTALKGAVGLPQTAVGLLNILDTINRGTAPPGMREAAGDPTSRPGVAQALANAGLRFDDAQKALDTFYSPAQQAANRKVAEADGFVPTLQAALENPSTIGHTAIESVPQMLGGAAIGRAIASAAPRVAPWLAGALGEGAVGAGGAAEQIRNDPASGGELTLGQALMALGSGATTAAIGAAGGRFAQKLGLSDVDTMLVSGVTKLKAAPLQFARQVLGSGISEGLFEELPQSITEQMWQNYATGKPVFDGVGKAGAMGMLTGAAMGAAGGGFNAAMAPRAGTEAAPAATPSVPGETKPATSGTLDPIPATEVLGDETAPAPRGTAPEPTDAEKALLKPRPLTALDRVQAIDRELGDSATPEETAASLRAERADLVKDWPSATPGAATSLTTEAGARVDAQYALMDIDALVTSHDADLRRNEAYPRELQPRERDRAASEMQVQAITQKLDPARLGASADAATGAPIVGADGLVESGNARTIAMKRVYQADGLVADEYRAWLRASAGQFGLTPEQIDGMAKPMLVRVRTTPVDRAEFARQANAPTVAAMSPVEQARSDANRIDAMDDLQPDDNGDFATSRDFIRRFVGRLPLTEQAGMLDAGGRLSSSGYARVRNAVLAKAYGDSPVLTRMVESMNDDMRNVSRALMIAAPRVAQARGAIAEGRRFDADITPHLVGAAEELSRLKERGTSVDDALAQSGLLGDEFSPETRELMRFIADNMRRPRRMAEFITGYFDALDAAGDPAQGSLLGAVEAPRTSDLMQVARRALEGTDDRETSEDAGGRQPGGDRAPDAGQPADAPSDRRGAQGNDPAAGQDWVDFPESTGTLGIPRAEMPQVPGKDRGALVNFLEARGIAYERTEVAADSLRPTQREFSRKKVQQARQDTGAAKTVVVSGDGYVLDGHHRWMAQLVDGQPVDVMRFDAPIRELLAAVREFPGTKSAAPPTTPARDAKAQALADFQDALADLGVLMSRYTRATMQPEELAALKPTLVKLAGAALRIVGTDLRRVMQWVREALRRSPETKKYASKITPQALREAAEEALKQRGTNAPQAGLFDEPELEKQLDLFASTPARPRQMVKIDGVEYDLDAPNFGLQVPPRALPDAHPLLTPTIDKPTAVVDGKEVARAELQRRIVEGHFKNAEPAPADRKPIAYVMGGGGASGKGTILEDLRKRGVIQADKAVHVDPDEIKKQIPEYQAIIDAKDARAAALTHRESSLLATQVKERAVGERYDLVLDVTLGDPVKGAKVLQSLKDAGYEVRLFGVTIDPRVAVVRAMKRAETSFRYVPITDLLAAHKGFTPAFEAYAGIADEAVLMDNTGGVESLETLARKDGGRLTFTDRGRYNGVVQRSASVDENAGTLRGIRSEDADSSGGRTQSAGGGVDSGSLERDRGRLDERGSGRSEAPVGGVDRGGSGQVQGLTDAPAGEDSRGGAQGPAPRPAGRREGADGRGDGGPGLFDGGERGAGATPGGEVGSPGADGVRGPDADGRGDGARSRNRRGAGTPAGRDIKPKSGLNFRFTDEDLSTAGSWFQKATRNVEAVELLRQLEKDGRQATPDEQRTLARFIGWGASDIANGLFSPERTKLAKVFEEYQRLRDRIEQEGLKEFGRSDRDYWTVYPKAAAAAGGRLGYGQPIPASVVTPESFGLKSEDVRWLGLRARLRAVLTDAEWAAAERTTQYAHYTSAPIVRAMWAAAQRFGFAGGAVLEPGAGNGMFPGLMPEGMATSSSYTGIEYDPITGGILKQLQPDEHILVESYVDTKLPRDFFDIAIGNPPFSRGAVLADPEYAKRAFSLHDYFFAKTLDRVKPGGLVMFVSSRYTMDKQNDKARQYLAERADLVGAIRLPQTAFKGNAGTEVVTDVLFLRKKVPGETFEQAQPWLRTEPVKVGDQLVPVNEYFAAHPEMILGTPALVRGMRKENEYSVLPPDGDIGDLFAKAVERMPAGIYKAARGSAAEAAQVREIDFNPKAKKEGNYYVTDAGVLMQREGGVGMRVDRMTPKDQAIVKAFVPLRDALKQAHYDQLTDGDWESSLKALQAEYEKFTAAHGQVNQFVMRTVKVKVDELDEDGQPTGRRVTDEEERRSYPLLNLLRDDPDHSLVAALERVDDETGKITPSAFLTARVLGKPEPAKILTPHDALLRSLNDLGRVDIDAIAESLDLPPADAVEALGTAIYEDPSEGWQTADQYLSGNVKRKLRDARTAAKNDRRFERNVAALEAAQPAPKNQAQIDVRLGVNWVQGSDYARFLKEVAGVRANVQWNDATRQWSVDVISGHKTAAATVDWGTARRHAGEILEIALTGRPIRITDTVDAGGGSKKTVFNPTATEAANAALTKMREEFTRWVWTDEERASRLVTTYNDRFNTTVPRSFDGRHLTLPGTSKQFHIFDHVKRGAWRIIQSGNTYLAHAVGSGKTFQMVIAAMEQKRLGLVKKPMVVVPNHMLQQFAREWQELYPAARLMIADENNFHTENRRRFVSRVALSDLDGVIITHSAFKLLDLDPEFKAKIIQEQLDYMRAALEEAKEEGERTPRVKQIQARIETFEQKLQAALSSEGKDRNVRFDELGVDQLFVDEAHAYRKLDFATARQIKGIQPEGSDQAMDLYIKSRYLEEKHPGRSLVMASGTVITNTLAEMYTVQRFLGRKALEEAGIEDFDSWAAMFGREKTDLEPNAAGKYEPVTRFKKFVNVGELVQMFREFADVVTADQLAALLGDKRPKVEGGSRQIIVTPKVESYRAFQKQLEQRYEVSRKWKPTKEEPHNPDPIVVIIGDGRLAAIDMRFVGGKNDPDSKLNRMIDDVIRTFKETADLEYHDKAGNVEPIKGATMMVFSDLGFGAGVAQSRGFNARQWFEKRLRDAGVPLDQVAFMSDYKKSTDKLKLFKDMNAGRKRILVGSSKNMGTGVNAQQRLHTMFHLDSPWFPADLEQREGRIVRQGNKNKLVHLRAYAAKGTYDEQMWKLLASKQHFIDQAMSGDPNLREVEDLDNVSLLDQAAALVAEDPRVMQLAGARADAARMERLQLAHEEQRMRFRKQFRDADATILFYEQRLADADKAAAKVQDLSGDKFKAKAGTQTYTERVKWGEMLLGIAKNLAAKQEPSQTIGEISGFPVRLVSNTKAGETYTWHVMLDTPLQTLLIDKASEPPIGIAMRAQNAVADTLRAPAAMREAIAQARAQQDAVRERLTAPFPMAGMLADKLREIRDLEAQLAAGPAGEALDEESAIGAAASGMVPPIVMSRGEGGPGISMSRAQRVADRIKAALPGLPPIRVMASPRQLGNDGADAQLLAFLRGRGAEGNVHAALHDGTIYLFADHLRDEAQVEHVLAEHEAGHVGLRGLLGDDLVPRMRAIFQQNKDLRQRVAAMLEKNDGMSLAEAVEEVLVDTPSADLAKLRGWRAVVGRMVRWLADHGFELTAARLARWLKGTLGEQEQADLYAANLVRAAREFVTRQRAVTAADTRLSSAATAAPAPAPEQPKTARERADEIIARVARTPAPVDAAARLLTRITGTAWAASKAYDLGAKLLDRITPEAVKAGVVSDYGVPEAVIDQRAMMQGRQRQALRGAGALLEKLATLTRAESRIAYEWMNMDGSDPRAYLSMMQGLPEESVKVLQEVQQLIDSLSKEAVRLGQLEPEAFERHRFAYLRRSYAKHTAELTSGDKARRQRAISILGDQYKGRGMVQSVAMDRVKAVAPEWWQRKLQAGKADTALKGQKFVRLERRVMSQSDQQLRTYKTVPSKIVGGMREAMLDNRTPEIAGLPAAKQRPRVAEVVYWPAEKAIPKQYAEWDNAGTWEVRDTKGPNLVMWRDFTKDERERMGEIDEARFAIAKTLQGMIHDVEVGRYLEYLAQRHAKADGDAVDGELVEASERYRDTFAPGTWVKVPDAKIPGTSVAKYGKLAGQYLPGPIWNDLRQVVNGKFKPFGEAYDEILRAWKISKTALSPAVHTNNIMSNVVMADWHGVSAGHVVKALGLVMAASDRRAANALGARDREAAREILARYQDSGGAIGGWVTQELREEQMAPILEALRRELQAADQGQAQIGVYAAMQHMLHARFPQAVEALRGSTSAAKAKAAASVLIDLYQAEDDVFRLAAWLKAKEEGATDPDAGKVARRSFLDYSINAPWIQAMRSTAFPFISFTYRAVPMLLEVAGRNPHKLLKLMALAGGLNALGVMLGGGGDDDERKLLPEEKAGRIWGMVPKLIRMPWNDAHGSPVYLDIRRWIPVGDVVDVAQGHAAVPLLPAMYPGGPLAVLGEVIVNKSMFTGKPITLETDTGIEKARKVTDHLWKAFAPNLLGLPGTYATTGVVESFEGRTDKFGREMSTAQALASSVGVKLGSYPADVLRNNLMARQRAELAEVDRVIGELRRQRQTNRIDAAEFEERMQAQQAKKLRLRTELAEKMN